MSQQDSSKFSKYLFFIYGILIARPEKHWSPLIQYIIEQVLFNNPTFFKDNSTLITEITKLFRKYYIDSLQNAINTDFLRCAGNNFPLALNVCYQTQTKMPFLSHIRYSLILNPIKFSLDLIEKLASVNSDQTIDKEEYESLKNPINKNFFTEEAFEYLINYIDSQVTIQEHANPISLEQNDNEKDNENKGNDDENQEENTKIDENQNENENADDEEDEKANEEEEIKENNENNQSDKNQEEELAPPELIEENEDKKILFLELGVGRMTPMFIQHRFWNMVNSLPNAYYITINPNHAILPARLANKGHAIHEDIAPVFRDCLALMKKDKEKEYANNPQ